MNTKNFRKSESGNVLFLILIAVALFAALSYVVTQSTRSGGGSTEREQNILSSAQMTQYPTALRTALIRMILAGVSVETIAFNSPATFGSVSDYRLVFHPKGGGAVYQDASANLMVDSNVSKSWIYSASFEVPDIGQNGAGGNDVIAFLPNISSGVCRQVNEELGLDASTCTAGMVSGVPDTGIALSDVTATLALMDDDYVFPSTDVTDIVSISTGCTTIFSRQASGCFATSDDKFVFYSVLLER